MNNFNKITSLLMTEIQKRFPLEPLSGSNLEFSDNFAELLEKLVILHIRVWKMEDKVGVETDAQEIANLKKKIDFCFKIKRPQLLRVINLMMDDYISKHKNFSEENVKLYAGGR